MKVMRSCWVTRILIRWAASLTLDSIISKDIGCSENVKSRIAKAQGVISQLKKVWKNRKISLQTIIRISGATVMTLAKCGSEAWVLKKTGEFARCFPEKLRETVKCLGHIMQMKDEILLKIVLIGQLPKAKQKAVCSQIGWDDIVRR